MTNAERQRQYRVRQWQRSAAAGDLVQYFEGEARKAEYERKRELARQAAMERMGLVSK